MESLSNGETHYEVLDLPPEATRDEIRDSYRRLIGELGGGVKPGSELDTQRGLLREALEVLNHPMRRAAYDRRIGSSPGSDEHISLEDIKNEEPLRLSTAEEARAMRPEVPGINERARAAADAVARSYELRKQEASRVRVEEPQAELPPANVGDLAPSPERYPVVEVNGAERLTRFEDGEREMISQELPGDEQVLEVISGSSAVTRLASRYQALRERGRKSRIMGLASEVGEGVLASGEFDGGVFIQLRESLGASLEDIVEITKINKRYLTALEENDYGTLPGATYVKGFVGQYAEALGLDASEVAAKYMKGYRQMESN